MKILSNDGKPWTKEFVCRECKSSLEVVETDLRVVNTAVSYAGESWEPEVVFTCAACHSDNYVTKNVPSGISYKLTFEAAKSHRRN